MAVQETSERGGPRKLLALDGGGIRGLISVEVLAKLETQLQRDRGDEFVLAEVFDYVAGTSTGTSPKANQDLDPDDMNLIFNANSVPSALMFAALNEQDLLCRVFGDCRHGAELDREVGTLNGARGPVDPKLFTYVRYNAELTREWLEDNGLGHIDPRNVQRLDSTAHMDELAEVGRRVADQVVAERFEGF